MSCINEYSLCSWVFKGVVVAGKCKYCGFVGTNDEMVDHAGEMCYEWNGETRLKIDRITEFKYDYVRIGNCNYKRYSNGFWSTFSCIGVMEVVEKNVDGNLITELEQAYQEFKQKGK